MNSQEISGLLKGLAFVALGYVLCLHHQAAKCACKGAPSAPQPGNTGIVPPGYGIQTAGAMTLDQILAGAV